MGREPLDPKLRGFPQKPLVSKAVKSASKHRRFVIILVLLYGFCKGSRKCSWSSMVSRDTKSLSPLEPQVTTSSNWCSSSPCPCLPLIHQGAMLKTRMSKSATASATSCWNHYKVGCPREEWPSLSNSLLSSRRKMKWAMTKTRPFFSLYWWLFGDPNNGLL